MSPDYFQTALRGLYEAQRLNSESLGHLIQTVDRFIDSTNANVVEGKARMALGEEFSLRLEQSQLRMEESYLRLERVVERYVDAANARMQQMEKNLDALIRVITAEHSNGKGQH